MSFFGLVIAYTGQSGLHFAEMLLISQLESKLCPTGTLCGAAPALGVALNEDEG